MKRGFPEGSKASHFYMRPFQFVFFRCRASNQIPLIDFNVLFFLFFLTLALTACNREPIEKFPLPLVRWTIQGDREAFEEMASDPGIIIGTAMAIILDENSFRTNSLQPQEGIHYDVFDAPNILTISLNFGENDQTILLNVETAIPFENHGSIDSFEFRIALRSSIFQLADTSLNLPIDVAGEEFFEDPEIISFLVLFRD